MGFLGKQFIDVIDWTESENGVLAYRFPMEDREIQNGGKLTVRDSQLALFVNEGQIADAFKPGLYTLTTNTLPVLTYLKNWDKAFKSPFKSDVYFFSTREQVNQHWGTQAPVTVRDNMFGVIRLRAHGTYSYQIEDQKAFYEKISGSRERYTTEEIEGQLRAMILTSMATLFGTAEVSFLDMAANQTSFSQHLKEELSTTFSGYGLKLASFFVQSITLPEELQAHLDKVSSMRMVGDLRQYAQFQAAEAIPMAAQNEGGLAGAGAGLGAGLAVGQAFSAAFGNVGQPHQDNSAPTSTSSGDPYEALSKLHDLLTKGIVTQEEFDAKKAELLGKIT